MEIEEDVELPQNTINIILWNTKLAPPASKAIDDDRFAKVKNVLKDFIISGFDFICLVEVSLEVVDKIKLFFKEHFLIYDVADGTDKIGRTRFDTCIIYKSRFEKLASQNGKDSEHLTSAFGDQTHKCGQKFDFIDYESNDFIHFVMTHWASPLTPDIDKKRNILASDLRISINQWLENHKNMIVLGDFNTEPYCPSITELLKANREKDSFIREKDFNYLYNPTWSFLNLNPPTLGKVENKILGTYYYKQGKPKRWYSFDQVMFSRHLVESGHGWEYVEDSLRIVAIFDVVADDTFDHLPIQFSLRRSSNE